MANNQGQGTATASKKTGKGVPPRSLEIAERGVSTSKDFRNLMSAIMSDVISGRLTPNMTNAACNAGGKLLKMVDLEYKYGTDPESQHRTLAIAFETPELRVVEEQTALGSGKQTA